MTFDDLLTAVLADTPELSAIDRQAAQQQTRALAAIVRERREIAAAHEVEMQRHAAVLAVLDARTVKLTEECPHPVGMIEQRSGQEMRRVECRVCGKDISK